MIEQVVQKIVTPLVSPFYDDRYESQKSQFANDPEFQKYAPQIDEMVRQQPQLKQQPGIVSKLYNAARALSFNVEDERRRIETEIRQKLNLKVEGTAEGVGSPGAGPSPTPVTAPLTDDEKRVAVKFNPSVPAEEAYKLYAKRKATWEAR